MCELLAMSANTPTDICFSFTGLMQRGGNTGPHKDGWGITFYEGRGCRTFKDPLPSIESKIATLVTDYPIKSTSVICHIRQANAGPICLENTHPFTRNMWGENWSYAHNGQLSNYKEVMPVKAHIPVGDTDSEYAFCYILDQLHYEFGANEPDPHVLFQFIAKQCHKINHLGVFNITLTNGKYLFTYCSNNLHWLTRQAPFGKAQLIDAELTVDFQQHAGENDIITVIATQPLTSNEQWLKMESTEWILFHLGEKVLSGRGI